MYTTCTEQLFKHFVLERFTPFVLYNLQVERLRSEKNSVLDTAPDVKGMRKF
jgi:hypothetical protein